MCVVQHQVDGLNSPSPTPGNNVVSVRICGIVDVRAVFDRGVGGGVDPPQEVADPQKVLQNLFGGLTLTPPP